MTIPTIHHKMTIGPTRGYATLPQFVADWRLLFSNSLKFNREESEIYRYTEQLEKVFEKQLVASAKKYGFNLERELEELKKDD